MGEIAPVIQKQGMSAMEEMLLIKILVSNYEEMALHYYRARMILHIVTMGTLRMGMDAQDLVQLKVAGLVHREICQLQVFATEVALMTVRFVMMKMKIDVSFVTAVLNSRKTSLVVDQR